MIPSTVGGDVTWADAPVTSHPVVPIAIVPTISDVFLKERRLFEPLNLCTLPPAGFSLDSCGSFELEEPGHHSGRTGANINASVQPERQAVHPPFELCKWKELVRRPRGLAWLGARRGGVKHDGPPWGAARRSSSRVYGVLVTTGPVVISPGGDAQARYNALGDTVNVAARLQALAEDSRVMLGPQTAAQVRGAFELEALGARELRGRAGPVDLFRVVGEIEPGPPPAGATLVGRNVELAAVRGALQQLVDGLGAIVSITGEPGIGKSRLLAEALGPVRDRLRVLEGRGLSYTEAFPYWPLRELLRDWLGAGVTTTEARVRLDLKAALRGLFDDADEVYPFLATMLGLTPDPESSQRLREFSRDAAHRRSVEVVAELMRGLARERPLLIVFEDLHWADQPSLDLIEGLLDLTEREPVGIVMLYRADRELGSWRVGEHAPPRFPPRHPQGELRPLPGEAP